MCGAIKTITNMVLISIHPFAVRKVFLALGVLLCLSALCFADPVLMAQHYAALGLGTSAHGGGEELTDLKPVDFPSRGQELLPSKDAIDQSIEQPEALFRSCEESVWAEASA